MNFKDWGGLERLEPSPLPPIDEVSGLAVVPGQYDLAIIRGITFSGLVLQCRDENATVTGTIVPDATGLYVPSGVFADHQLYILAGAPSYFLYFSPLYLGYLISDLLTTGTVTNSWAPTPAQEEPSGTYTPFGTFTGTADVSDNPRDLTGYTVEAVVRRNDTEEVLIDLQPMITDAVNGEITIPPIAPIETEVIPYVGLFHWDLVLNDGVNRFGPYIEGKFWISDNTTQLE